MIITKRHLPRRTVLRGLGATLALPLLDGMVPALTPEVRTAAAPVRRLVFLYPPNGMSMGYWTPPETGSFSERLPPTFVPLQPYRDRLTIVSGLDNTSAPQAKQGGQHAKASGCFLTATVFDARNSADVKAGVSVDQVAARTLGQATQLASLELSLDPTTILGECNGTACSLSNNISWRTETLPNQPENDPRAVFERLFGTTTSTDAAARLERIERDRSILDFVNAELASLQRSVSVADRVRLDEYTESVRDVERRIQKATEQNARELPVVDQPMGIPQDFGEHARLMLDLLALALQTDLTRVATFMYGMEVSGRAYPEIGISDSHHPLSHHQNDAAKLERLHKINIYHMVQFAHFVERLKTTEDAGGSVLDGCLLVYATGISDSNQHLYTDVPVALVAGAATGLTGGRHIRFERGTRLANLWLAALHVMDVPAERFGDSTGVLPL